MAGDPHQQVRRGAQFVDELAQRDGVAFFRRDPLRLAPPFHLAADGADGDRHMRGDDHQLVVRLPRVELVFQPRPARRIEIAMAVDVARAVVARLGVVEHDHLERETRFRREAVAGKSGIARAEATFARQMEAVADRPGRRVEEFL